MTFNKSEIMTRAWAIARKADVAKHGLRLILRNALRTAWSEAKYAVEATKRAARAALPRTPADKIREAILVLDCKTRWTQADYARHSDLNHELRAA